MGFTQRQVVEQAAEQNTANGGQRGNLQQAGQEAERRIIQRVEDQQTQPYRQQQAAQRQDPPLGGEGRAGLACLRALKGEEAARQIASDIVYRA